MTFAADRFFRNKACLPAWAPSLSSGTQWACSQGERPHSHSATPTCKQQVHCWFVFFLSISAAAASCRYPFLKVLFSPAQPYTPPGPAPGVVPIIPGEHSVPGDMPRAGLCSQTSSDCHLGRFQPPHSADNAARPVPGLSAPSLAFSQRRTMRQGSGGQSGGQLLLFQMRPNVSQIPL